MVIFLKKIYQKTTNAIEDLTKNTASKCKKEVNKSIVEIPFSEIQINDILIVNNGDKIPSDGIIIEGYGLIDESIVTGESLLLPKI